MIHFLELYFFISHYICTFAFEYLAKELNKYLFYIT